MGGLDTLDFAHLDRRPLSLVAALPGVGGIPGVVFAVTERLRDFDPLGGRLWAVGPTGASLPGFPVTLPSPATTPPLVSGDVQNGWLVYVGCADGRVRCVHETGSIVATSGVALFGGVSGRLALSGPVGLALPPSSQSFLAAGDSSGNVNVMRAPNLGAVNGWPQAVGGS